jgi:hypothetical protein
MLTRLQSQTGFRICWRSRCIRSNLISHAIQVSGNSKLLADQTDLIFHLSVSGDENAPDFLPTSPGCIVKHISTPEDIRDQLALRPVRSAIVLGDRRRLTGQFIIDVERHMSEAGVVWGLWCRPPTCPTLEALGKGATAGRPDLVIDVPQGSMWSHDRGWRALGDVRLALKHRTGVCSLIAHGDGSHLDLGEAILCGLTDDAETAGNGPIEGGCTRSSCKKQPAHPGYLLHADEINTELLVILSCNSMSLASELYPSSLSLALSAASSKAIPVIGTISQLPFSGEAAIDILRGIREAVNIGTSVAVLNARWKTAGIPCAYALLGDPRASFTEIRKEAVGRAAAPRLDNYDVTEAGAGPAWLLRNTMDAVTRAATGVALQQGRLTRPLLQNVQAMARAQALLDSRVWRMLGPSAIGETESLLGMTQARRLVGPALEELRDALGSWGNAVLELASAILLTGTPGLPVFGDKLAEVLGQYLTVEEHRSCGPCPRCRTRLVAYKLNNRVLPMYPRRRILCPVCGPVGDQVDGALKVSVHPRTYTPRKGRDIDLDVQVTAQSDVLGLTSWPLHLLVEVRDKSMPTAVYCKLLALQSSSRYFRHIGAVPLGKGADLHSVRVIAVRCGLVASARCLLSPIP